MTTIDNYHTHDFTMVAVPMGEGRKGWVLKCSRCACPFTGTPDDRPAAKYPPCASNRANARIDEILTGKPRESVFLVDDVEVVRSYRRTTR